MKKIVCNNNLLCIFLSVPSYDLSHSLIYLSAEMSHLLLRFVIVCSMHGMTILCLLLLDYFRELFSNVSQMWLIINLSVLRLSDWSFKIYNFQHTTQNSNSWICTSWGDHDHVSTRLRLLPLLTESWEKLLNCHLQRSKCSTQAAKCTARSKIGHGVMTGNAKRLFTFR